MTSKRFIKTIGQAFICLFVFSFLMTSCKCSRTSDIAGPEACPSANFSCSPLLVKDNASSTNSINLATSYANLSSTFNESISYTLIISGQTSGAVFKLEGEGSSINLNWYGNSNNGKYFLGGEMINCSLTNLCKTEPITSGSATISPGIISYSGLGVKVINFDESPVVNTNPSLTTANLITPSAGHPASPQGGNYFHYDSTGAPVPTWYFSYLTFNGINYTSLGTDPAKVYLNFFAKGKLNSQVQMIVYEMAHGIKLKRKFLANVSPDGWKLYSVKLSDIGILDPSQIQTLEVNFGAANYQDTSCDIDLDMVILTKDQPF